jgi:hypothetical protein
VSTRISATEHRGSIAAAKYLVCSCGVTTRSRCAAILMCLRVNESRARKNKDQ